MQRSTYGILAAGVLATATVALIINQSVQLREAGLDRRHSKDTTDQLCRALKASQLLVQQTSTGQALGGIGKSGVGPAKPEILCQSPTHRSGVGVVADAVHRSSVPPDHAHRFRFNGQSLRLNEPTDDRRGNGDRGNGDSNQLDRALVWPLGGLLLVLSGLVAYRSERRARRQHKIIDSLWLDRQSGLLSRSALENDLQDPALVGSAWGPSRLRNRRPQPIWARSWSNNTRG